MKKKVSELSPCYLRCIKLAADGMLNKEIAFELGMAPSTVKTYFADALGFTGLRSRAHLTAEYVRQVEVAKWID